MYYTYVYKHLHKFAANDLKIECFTNVTGGELSGRNIQLFFDANQDGVTFRCRLNEQAFVACEKKLHIKYIITMTNHLGTSPQTFTNVDFSETVTVTVEGTTLLTFPTQTAKVNKTGNHYIRML